jgi:CheY-like chemotaxis protein
MIQPDLDPRKMLRKALNHLYNPDYLHRSPLVPLVGLSGRFDAAKLLQRVLLRAIDDVQYRPAGSRQERMVYYHDLLQDRYVTKLGQEAVAARLGISLRQLVREQDHAVDILATVLAGKYPELAKALNPRQDETVSLLAPVETSFDRYSLAPEIPLRLSHMLEEVVGLFEALLQRKGAKLSIDISPGIAGVQAHPAVLRQTLLATIDSLLRLPGCRELIIQARQAGSSVQVCIHTPGSSNPSLEVCASVNPALRLMEQNGGALNLSESSEDSLTILTLPAFQGRLAVVLDDDAVFIDFLQSALVGSRYQVAVPEEPAQALTWVRAYGANVILLDVMAATFNGWQLLKQLHLDPLAGLLPVIVCSSLPVPDLAFTLGAASICTKPIGKTELVDTLDRLVGAT